MSAVNDALERLALAAVRYGAMQDLVERHRGLFVDLRDEARDELTGSALEYFAQSAPAQPAVKDDAPPLTDAEVAGGFAAAGRAEADEWEADYADHCVFCGETGNAALSRTDFAAFRVRHLARVGSPDGVTQDHDSRDGCVTEAEARRGAIEAR